MTEFWGITSFTNFYFFHEVVKEKTYVCSYVYVCVHPNKQ